MNDGASPGAFNIPYKTNKDGYTKVSWFNLTAAF